MHIREWVVAIGPTVLAMGLLAVLASGCGSTESSRPGSVDESIPASTDEDLQSAASSVFAEDEIQEVRSVQVEELRSWSVILRSDKPTADQVAEMLLLMHDAQSASDAGVKLTLLYPSDTGMGLGIDIYWNPTETTKTADLQDLAPGTLLVGQSERDRLSFNTVHTGEIVRRHDDVSVDRLEAVAQGTDNGSWLVP